MKRLLGSNLILIFILSLGLFQACRNSAEKNNEAVAKVSSNDFRLTDGKLGYPTVASFLLDVNFDGKPESLVAAPKQGQRGRTLFTVFDSEGNKMTADPYHRMDSETKIDAGAKEVTIHSSGGACGSVIEIYQPKSGQLELVKRLKQNMEDGKCFESTFAVSKGIESFVSKRELTLANKTIGSTDQSSLASDIQFIQEKYKIISNAKDYKTIPFTVECDFRSSTKLDRQYNDKGELSYLKYVDCGGHGCRTRHHYYWEGALIFLFQVDDFTPGSSHEITEYRTYFKNGQMIRCLKKKVHYYEGQPPMAELLKKAENQAVDCTAERLTKNLSELEVLNLDEAKKYFCPSS